MIFHFWIEAKKTFDEIYDSYIKGDNYRMEKNFNDMTLKELEKLQELISTEIEERREKERTKAKNKIEELFKEIDKLCRDYNIWLYDYDGEDFSMDMLTIEDQ